MAVETCGLTKRYGDHLAVDNVSMRVPERAIYGLLGRNGAGKSTTLRLLMGLMRPDVGTVQIVGVDVTRDRVRASRNFGALLEAHGFYGHLSGRENLELSRRLLDLPATEVPRVLDVTEMTAHSKKRVSDYSLGMRQRLGLARAMLGSPAVLILDEPTNGLDAEGIEDMRRFVRELPDRSGSTVLISSHQLDEIDRVATHVGILCQGRLVVEGSVEDLKEGSSAEVVVETASPARAIAIAREHGFDVMPEGDVLVARFKAHEDLRSATSALNHLLCTDGEIRVHALVPRERSLGAIYRNAPSVTN